MIMMIHIVNDVSKKKWLLKPTESPLEYLITMLFGYPVLTAWVSPPFPYWQEKPFELDLVLAEEDFIEK